VEALQGPPTSKLSVGLKAGQAEAGNDDLTVAMDDHRMLEKVATDPVVGPDNPQMSQTRRGSMVPDAVVGQTSSKVADAVVGQTGSMVPDAVVGQTGSRVADAVVGPDNRQMSQTGVADAVVGQTGSMVADAVVGPDNWQMSQTGVADAVVGTDTLGKSRKGSIVIEAMGLVLEAMGLVLDQQLEAVLKGQSARW
jgi:hypothetical protein